MEPLPLVSWDTGEKIGNGASPDGTPHWVKVIDQSRCIGCHACTTACKSENEVPLSVTRTYVKSVDVGEFPEARRNFQVTRCNQCTDAPCVTACPTSAMFKRDDGIVDFDKDACIGCKACMAACPYDAIFINPEDHSAEKCNFCAHRIDVGLEPACAVVCPVEAILVSDLNDPDGKATHLVNREPVSVRRPEKDTKPNLFYRGAHQSTLDPLAASQPPGDVFAFANQYPEDAHTMNAGVPEGAGPTSSSAAAMLHYDVGHDVPWDWRVGLYTFTKSIGAGMYLLAAIFFLFGYLDSGGLWDWATPVVSAAFLALTGAILIWDLEHPERFYYIFTRPQWKSWLVRGGIIIGAFGAILALHFLASLLDAGGLRTGLTVVGIPLAAMTGIYTAFLFAQAKARDLWQNPLLPAHLLVQAVFAGAAVLVIGGEIASDPVADIAATVLAWSAAAHVIMVLGEIALPHATAHARMATHTMIAGRFALPFWGGVGLAVLAIGAVWVPVPAAVVALVGLWAYEHAYVQAGQSVPLA